MLRRLNHGIGSLTYKRSLFGYMLFIKETRLNLTDSFECYGEVKKFRIIYNIKDGGYELWYKFRKGDKYQLLRYSDGNRFSYFDGLDEYEISDYLLTHTTKEFLKLPKIWKWKCVDKYDEFDDKELLEDLNNSRYVHTPKKLIWYKYGVCKYDTYFRREHEYHDEELINMEIRRLMEKDD